MRFRDIHACLSIRKKGSYFSAILNVIFRTVSAKITFCLAIKFNKEVKIFYTYILHLYIYSMKNCRYFKLFWSRENKFYNNSDGLILKHKTFTFLHAVSGKHFYSWNSNISTIIEKMFSWLHLLWPWRLKFSFYNDLSKYAVRFFCHFIELWALSGDYNGAARRATRRAVKLAERCDTDDIYTDTEKSEDRNVTASHFSQYVSRYLRRSSRNSCL